MSFNEMFEFENTGRGCELTKYIWNNSGNVTEITIPPHVDGRPVTRIGERVFKGAWQLKTIRVPDTVTEIGDGAFYGTFGLEEINIPRGIKTIKDSTFRDCENLREIIIPEGVADIGMSAFRNTPLRTVTLPQSLKTLGDSAFEDCLQLTNVTFSNNSVRLGKNVFLHCAELPPEIKLMGLVCSPDITRPVSRAYAKHDKHSMWLTVKCEVLVYDFKVFELAAKNNCFRDVTVKELAPLLSAMAAHGQSDHIRTAAENGLVADAELLDSLIDISSKNGYAEMTAFLLDHKNRTLGFDKGEKYDL